jgi:hypothetical protein
LPSARGDGILGHYILVVKAAVYELRSVGNVPFVLPVNAGLSAIHIVGATGPQIAEGNRVHGLDTIEFNTYLNTEAALKQQVIQAVPEVFYEQLGDDAIGYANVSTKQILAHLDTTYGTLSEDDIDRNLKLMNSPCSVHEPIESLFTRLKGCRTFAANSEPIPESSAVRAGLQILEATNVFPLACQE